MLRRITRGSFGSFFLLSVLSLSIGIAAFASAFSVVFATVLRPVPFPASSGLVTIGLSNEDGTNQASPFISRLLDGEPRIISHGMVSAIPRRVNVQAHSPLVADLISAEPGFFHALSLAPAAGRWFVSDDSDTAAVVSDGFARRSFGSAEMAVGATLTVDGTVRTVVGVAGREFRWLKHFDVVTRMPLRSPDETATNEYIVARLNRDSPSSSDQFAISNRLTTLLPTTAQEVGVVKESVLMQRSISTVQLRDLYVAPVRSSVALAFGIAICLSLLVLINLVNMFVFRKHCYQADAAVRTALGAGRWASAMPLVSEGLLVAGLATLVGWALAAITLQFLPHISILSAAKPSLGVAFFGAVGVATTACFAVAGVAIIGLDDRRVLDSLKLAGRVRQSEHSATLQRIFVVVQSAIASSLVLIAVQLAFNVRELLNVPLGFDPKGVLTFQFAPDAGRYSGADAISLLSRDLITRFREESEVAYAAVSTNLPSVSQLNMPVRVNGRVEAPQYRAVSEDFFKVFAIPLLAGRSFESGDVADSEPVCLVSAGFARTHLGDDAIGSFVMAPELGGKTQRMRVIGLVGDVRHFGPTEPAPATIYVPIAQTPSAVWQLIREFTPLAFSMRLRRDSGRPMNMAQIVSEVDSLQLIDAIATMDEVVNRSFGEKRSLSNIVALLAGLALLVATVGLFVVLATIVSSREHEFGVRAAMGETPAGLVRRVFSLSFVLVGGGTLMGVVVLLLSSKVLANHVFALPSVNFPAMLFAAATLLFCGLIATLLPIIRVLRVSPSAVLLR